MPDVNQIKKGSKVQINQDPYVVVNAEFVKPGKGNAFVRFKFKNLINGSVLERTHKSGESLDLADVIEKTMQYLYRDGDNFHFMDKKSYEQVALSPSQVNEASKWIKEEDDCQIVFYNDRAINCTPPNFATLKITYTEPAVKGNTSNRVMKKATLETGVEVDVPIFIAQEEIVRIDTRTGEYVDRAAK